LLIPNFPAPASAAILERYSTKFDHPNRHPRA
jgi:hypothetical protein